ncbi:hypothetical protein Btru_055029 [Bulinus truncatus]|nr:hypothetical protein Btru_055029 [Bulinus truncatus]
MTKIEFLPPSAMMKEKDIAVKVKEKEQEIVQNRMSFSGLLNADCGVTDFQKKFTVKVRLILCPVVEPGNKYNSQKCRRKLWPAANPASDLTLETDEEENHQDDLTKHWMTIP